MLSKVLVPKVRLKGFEEGWGITPLSELMTFSNGINAPKESYGKGRKMISVLDILDDVPLQYEGIRNSVSVNEKIENNSRVDKGDLVFVRSSEVVDEVGWAKSYLDDKYALYSGFSIRGKRKNKYDALFLELSINEKAREQIERRSGGSTRFNVNQAILNELQIVMPDLSEQKEISRIFKTLNTNVNSRKHELTNLKNFKQAMFQKMFPKEGENEPKVRFEGFSRRWEELYLEDIINITTGSLDANESTPYGKYPFFTTSDKLLRVDSYGFVGPSITLAGNGVMGNSTYVPDGVKFNAYQRVYVLTQCEHNYYYPFINQSISKYLPTEITKRASGSVISYITKDVLEKLIIRLPSLEEQKSVGKYIQLLEKNIQSKEEELQKLNQFKKAMLQKMFV